MGPSKTAYDNAVEKHKHSQQLPHDAEGHAASATDATTQSKGQKVLRCLTLSNIHTLRGLWAVPTDQFFVGQYSSSWAITVVPAQIEILRIFRTMFRISLIDCGKHWYTPCILMLFVREICAVSSFIGCVRFALAHTYRGIESLLYIQLRG